MVASSSASSPSALQWILPAIGAGLSLYMVYKQFGRQNVHSRSTAAIISKIIIYPVKGCRGVELQECVLTLNGFVGDHEYALVYSDPSESSGMYTAVSQSKCPKIATLTASHTAEGALRMSSPSGDTLLHTPSSSGPSFTIDFWGDTILVSDQGDSASEWLSSYLGIRCRLCRLVSGMHRRSAGGMVENSLLYKSPILLISHESIDSMQTYLKRDLHYNRFRPNIMISGCGAPFQEDLVGSMLGPDYMLCGFELCDRCSYPGVDQETGILDTRLVGQLRSLRNYPEHHPKYTPKTDGREYFVGVNMAPLMLGTGAEVLVHVGQKLMFQCE